MPRPISLSEVVTALQLSDAPAVYFDKATGRVSVPAQGGEQLDAPTEPQYAQAPEGIEALTFTESDEIELARQFIETVKDPQNRQRLHLALSAPSPREAFEDALFRCRIANGWFPFRDERLLRLAKDWLDGHHVAYTDDMNPAAN